MSLKEGDPSNKRSERGEKQDPWLQRGHAFHNHEPGIGNRLEGDDDRGPFGRTAAGGRKHKKRKDLRTGGRKREIDWGL